MLLINQIYTDTPSQMRQKVWDRLNRLDNLWEFTAAHHAEYEGLLESLDELNAIINEGV